MSKVKKLGLAFGGALIAAQNSFAVGNLNLATAQTAVENEIAGASAVLATIIGIVIAVVLVMKLVKRAA